MKYKNQQSIGLSIFASIILAQAAHAASFTWDGNENSNWDTTSENWTTPAVFWPAVAGDNDAVFAGAAPGVIAVDAAGVSVNDITFSATGYNISGPGVLTLSETTNIITATAAATISANLAGTNGFTNAGVQNLALSGNNSGLTGTITLNNITATNNAEIGRAHV